MLLVSQKVLQRKKQPKLQQLQQQLKLQRFQLSVRLQQKINIVVRKCMKHSRIQVIFCIISESRSESFQSIEKKNYTQDTWINCTSGGDSTCESYGLACTRYGNPQNNRNHYREKIYGCAEYIG
jgi:hypothetical protein